MLNQINSPFTNINYEIKKGDTILKILKKYEVKSNEIETIINQYKKFGNSNQLLIGNIIDIIIEKNFKYRQKFYIKIFSTNYQKHNYRK